MPQLRILDFKKVKQKERDEAQTLFKGKKLKKSDKPRIFVPGEQIKKGFQHQNTNQMGNFNDKSQHMNQRVQPSKEDIDAIRVNPYKLSTYDTFKYNLICNLSLLSPKPNLSMKLNV